jgi:hypothetical protein
MLGKEGHKYTPAEIEEFNRERRRTISRAFVEGDAYYTLGEHYGKVIFSERLKQNAREEMEAEFKRREMEGKKAPPQTPLQQ